MTDTTQPQTSSSAPFPVQREDTIVPVSKGTNNRAGEVNFNGISESKGRGPNVNIPLSNGNLGIYKWTTNDQGEWYLSYAEYVYSDANRRHEAVKGTHVRLDSNHPEYVGRV